MVVYAGGRRACQDCTREWPLEAFPTGNRRKDGTYGRRGRCPECWREKARRFPSALSGRAAERKAQRYRERRQDPAEVERMRRASRESGKRRRRTSPEALESQRRASREYQRRRRQDAAWREAENRRRREHRAYLREHDPDAWLRLCERDRAAHHRRKRQIRRDRIARPRLPITPLLEYVEEKIAGEAAALHVAGDVNVSEAGLVAALGLEGVLTPEARFCENVGMDKRTLHAWRNVNERVDVDLVDRVLTAYGEPWLIEVLYPDIDELLAV
jgi:hypothetical protein